MESGNKCVFLDRDGVLNQDLEGYLFKPEDLEIPEGVENGLSALKYAGFRLIVITNQAGIAKGLYDAADVQNVHRRMQASFGNVLEDLCFSPHHPDYSSHSLTRKPDSLLIEKAMARHQIDNKQSWMIGDKERDILAGKKAGVRTILIANPGDTNANYTVKNFNEAVNIILGS